MQDNISVGIIFKISNLQEQEREREMEEGGREEGRERKAKRSCFTLGIST